MDMLVRAHFLIERTQKHRLRGVAAGRGVSMSTLVREAVRLYLLTTSGPDAHAIRDRALQAIGALPELSRSTPGSDDDADLDLDESGSGDRVHWSGWPNDDDAASDGGEGVDADGWHAV